MPIYKDLPQFPFYPDKEKSIRKLHEHLPILSMADISAGHGGVFDNDYWQRKQLDRRVATDLFWLKPMAPEWEQVLKVDVQDMHQFADKSFDYVQCLETLEHVPDTFKALKELCRIARKMVLITSADEMHHVGEEQEAIEKINPNQKYICQPKVADLKKLGFVVNVDNYNQRQLIAWRIWE